MVQSDMVDKYRCSKIAICLFLMAALLIVASQAAGQFDKHEQDDLRRVEQFYKFDASKNHVNTDMALAASIAYYEDGDKALAVLSKWPKKELLALDLIINEFDESSFGLSDYPLADRPMAYQRSLRRFSPEIKLLAGIINPPIKVITGRLGAEASTTYRGNDGSADYILYPEDSETPVIVFLTVETIGYSEDEVYGCIDRRVRVHFKDERVASRIEYLGACIKSDTPLHAEGEEDFFTIEDFSHFNKTAQSLLILGYRAGFQSGCEANSSDEDNVSELLCDVFNSMACPSLENIIAHLLEISTKDKYKNLDLVEVLYPAVYGCLRGELDYEATYKYLDDNMKKHKQ